ncbi:SDR family NAD(P)-dependent oxidoreductase, partial [Alcanivorax sp. HI0007]|uniref:SDR family NAD(P)-dependent oxidoreductase n=1 Tax=Alcanivorax sp. HI0007 TaxID=1822218 RepID=UPI0012E87AD3
MMNILKFRSSKPSYNGYAVVTGAGSGIGRSFALELAKRNTAVVCADLKLESAEETVALIEKAGGKAYAVACDVGKATQVKKLSEQAEKLLGNPVHLGRLAH